MSLRFESPAPGRAAACGAVLAAAMTAGAVLAQATGPSAHKGLGVAALGRIAPGMLARQIGLGAT